MKKTILFLVGPTAAGKSKLGLWLAKKLNGEIVSADSMQVYRHMDIGTAKPEKNELRQVRHHLIDIVSPEKPFSVYDFRNRAIAVLHKIISRGKLPIVVGGSGLYVRALLEGLSGQPGSDKRALAQLEAEVKKKGLKALYGELKGIDPKTARVTGASNKRRILRALEIYRVSGIPPSVWYEKKESLVSLGFDPVVIGITRERGALYEMIEKRVDQMFRQGLVREVRSLAEKGLSMTARQAVGYKEVLAALRAGPGSRTRAMALAREQIKRNSRHYAKRQWTWFKRERGIHWISLDKGPNREQLCAEIMQLIEKH